MRYTTLRLVQIALLHSVYVDDDDDDDDATVVRCGMQATRTATRCSRSSRLDVIIVTSNTSVNRRQSSTNCSSTLRSQVSSLTVI